MTTTPEFDRRLFATVLKRAIGDRPINEYGRQVQISGSYISRLLRGLVVKAPQAPTIRKMAQGATNGVTYEELMIAAGHLPATSALAEILSKSIDSDKKTGLVHRLSLQSDDISLHMDEMGFDLISFMQEKSLSREDLEELFRLIQAHLHKKNQS